MAVTYSKFEQIDVVSFRLSWTSDATPPIPFRVYKNGTLVKSYSSSSQAGEAILTIGADESPFIEVMDTNAIDPAAAFTGYLTLHWLAPGDVFKYKVQEDVSGNWTTLIEILDSGQLVFQYLTRWLEDCETHSFRIVPVSAADNDGTPVTITALMVRHPDVPNVSYTYSNSTHKVTIAAA